MKDDVNFRIGDVELRIKQGYDTSIPEIVVWNSKQGAAEPEPFQFCFTAAYWIFESEGAALKFVGDRPFKDCDKDVFWRLAKLGQEILDEAFEKREEE